MSQSFLPNVGIKNSGLHSAAVQIVVYKCRIIAADRSGCIVEDGQKVLLDIANLRCVLFHAIQDELDMLRIEL